MRPSNIRILYIFFLFVVVRAVAAAEGPFDLRVRLEHTRIFALHKFGNCLCVCVWLVHVLGDDVASALPTDVWWWPKPEQVTNSTNAGQTKKKKCQSFVRQRLCSLQKSDSVFIYRLWWFSYSFPLFEISKCDAWVRDVVSKRGFIWLDRVHHGLGPFAIQHWNLLNRNNEFFSPASKPDGHDATCIFRIDIAQPMWCDCYVRDLLIFTRRPALRCRMNGPFVRRIGKYIFFGSEFGIWIKRCHPRRT